MRLLLASLSLCLFAAAPVAAQDRVPFPMFQRGDDLAGYFAEATAFVDEQPDSPYAPRVLFDLYWASLLAKNQSAADLFRTSLIGGYASHPEAQWAMATFQDVDEFRKAAYQQFESKPQRLAMKNDAYRLHFLFVHGHRRFGAGLLADARFALITAAIEQRLGNKDDAAAIIRQVRENDTEQVHGQFIAAAFEGDLSASDRAIALSGIQHPLSLSMQRYLVASLSDAERQTLAILRIRVEHAFAGREGGEALSLLRQLEDTDGAAQDEILYQRIWAATIAHKPQVAQEAAEQLLAELPDSPFADAARKLAPALSEQHTNSQTTLGAFDHLTNSVAMGFRGLEVRYEHGPPASDTPLDVHVFLRAVEPYAFAARVNRDGHLQYAHAVSDKSTRLWAQGNETIFHAEDTELLVVPLMELQSRLEGGYSFQLNTRISSNVKDLAAACQQLFVQPSIATRPKREKALNYVLSRGVLLLSASHDEETGWRIVAAGRARRLDDPSISITQLTLSANGRLLKWQADGRTVSVAAFAEQTESDVAIDWPDLPVETMDSRGASAAAVSRLMSGMVAAFRDPAGKSD